MIHQIMVKRKKVHLDHFTRRADGKWRIESFNSKWREEYLDQNWFQNTREASVIVEDWRNIYSKNRSHSHLEFLK